MKLGKKKLIVGMICLILCFSMTACSEETAKNLAQDIDDQVSNLKDIDESHVVSVRTGCPVLYPNISYGDAFTEFFDDPTWKYFKADTGEDVVEFTGYCMYREKKVKARLQFILNEKDNTFTQGALSFNDVPQTSIITSVMICKAFDEYAEKHKIENNTDTSEEDAMGSGTETQMNSGSESQTQSPQTEAPTEDETVTDEADSTDESVSNDDETTEDDSDDEYIIPDSDSKKLTKADLKGFSKKELRYARNEIYARHGRIFNDDELQAYFEGKSWYVGTQIAEEFDESELSKVEKANVRLIQKYENK